jgi:hypothetical protein
MSDPMETVERFAAQARREGAPDVEVAGRVLYRIREATRPAERRLALFAVGSLAAAAAAMVMVLPLLSTAMHPLAAFLQQSADIAAAITLVP